MTTTQTKGAPSQGAPSKTTRANYNPPWNQLLAVCVPKNRTDGGAAGLVTSRQIRRAIAKQFRRDAKKQGGVK